MSPNLKDTIRSFCLAAIMVSGIALVFLWSTFATSHPTVPDESRGLIYAFAIKGSKVFVTGVEATQYSMCWIVGFTSMVGILLTSPVKLRFPKSVEERLQLERQNIPLVEYSTSTRYREHAFFVSFVVCSALFWFLGGWFSQIFSSHLMVLNF